MRFAASLLLLAVCGFAAAQDKAPVVKPLEGKSETNQLFDGKTLAGWEGYEDLWSVKDGIIVARNEKPL